MQLAKHKRKGKYLKRTREYRHIINRKDSNYGLTYKKQWKAETIEHYFERAEKVFKCYLQVLF